MSEPANPIINGTDGDDTLKAPPEGGDLYGLEGNDTLTGSPVADNLYGGAGIDTLHGGGGSDMLSGGANDDLLYGGGGADQLLGGSGNDVLDGGAGADVMTGGAGNDTFYVDNAGDDTLESADVGIDTVVAVIDWSLADNIENLTLAGAAALDGTGNALANTITGNAAANVLDGGAGADILIGGAGDDTYYVDNAGDEVTELADGGVDTVVASVHWILDAEVENLVLTGSRNLRGTGNALDNTLHGNAGRNILNGNAGMDTMVGGAGDDTYVVDNAGDVVVELPGQGLDEVRSAVTWVLGDNVEDLTLLGTADINGTGNGVGNELVGNDGANVLTGGAGPDLLDGGAGNDLLNGGQGNDTFRLMRGGGADVLMDYGPGVTNRDVLWFGSDVTASQLWFRKIGDDLEVRIIGTGDRMTIQDWYVGQEYRVELFIAAGQELADDSVQALANAMAPLTMPAMGQTELTPAYAAQLQGVMASTWYWPIPG